MISETFQFPHSFYPNPGVNDAVCRVVVAGNVVEATELEENHSISITNAAEHLALLVCRKYEIDPKRLIWIEHYAPMKHMRDEDTYDLVQFNWDGRRFSQPRWTRMSGKARDALLASPTGDAEPDI